LPGAPGAPISSGAVKAVGYRLSGMPISGQRELSPDASGRILLATWQGTTTGAAQQALKRWKVTRKGDGRRLRQASCARVK
jgi:hypothetical protein